MVLLNNTISSHGRSGDAVVVDGMMATGEKAVRGRRDLAVSGKSPTCVVHVCSALRTPKPSAPVPQSVTKHTCRRASFVCLYDTTRTELPYRPYPPLHSLSIEPITHCGFLLPPRCPGLAVSRVGDAVRHGGRGAVRRPWALLSGERISGLRGPGIPLPCADVSRPGKGSARGG